MHAADMQTMRFYIERVARIGLFSQSACVVVRQIVQAVVTRLRSRYADVAGIMKIANDALRGVEQRHQHQQHCARTY